MNIIKYLILVLICFNVLAASENHFVRSDADCAGNGCGSENGTSYANAWRMMSDVSKCSTVGIQKNAGDVGQHNSIYDYGDVVQNESTLTTAGTGTITTNPRYNLTKYPLNPYSFVPLCGISPLINVGIYVGRYTGYDLLYNKGSTNIGAFQTRCVVMILQA